MAELPQYIQPMRMAEQGVVLQGRLQLERFTRLTDLLAGQKGQAIVDLQCGLDQERVRYIRGTIEAILPLECQRCLKTIDYLLKVKVNLSPVLSEAAANKLPERYEPLILAEDKLLLATLVEDELLLALPIAPKHETNCLT